MQVSFEFAFNSYCFATSFENAVFLADHQGSSQTDHCANTGFSSFKLPTCEWLQKGRSHSQMESSL